MEKATILLGSPTQLTVVIEVLLDARRIPLLLRISEKDFGTHRTSQEFLKEVAEKMKGTFAEYQDFYPMSQPEIELFWSMRKYWKEKHRCIVPRIEL